jgi:hypothetical protein
VCCGTKRLVEIRCPDSCSYLSSARSHPPAAIRRQQERDVAALAPAMAGLSEAQQQLALFTITLLDRFRGDGLDAAADADVADAAGALAATYETSARGVIYEQRPSSLPAQRIAGEIRTVFEQLGRQRPSAFAADAAAVLRRMEVQVAATSKAAPGNPKAFLDLAARLGRQLRPDGDSGSSASAGAAASPLVLP